MQYSDNKEQIERDAAEKSSKPKPEAHPHICPSKLSRRELEEVYYTLLQENSELKRTVAKQAEKIKQQNARVQRMSNTAKAYLGKDKDCCAHAKMVINEHKQKIQDLKKSNEALREQIMQLNARLTSAKQFLKRPSFQQTRQSRSSRGSTTDPKLGVPDLDSADIPKGLLHMCDENKCRTAAEEMKQKIAQLEKELAGTHGDYASRIDQLESQVADLRTDNFRASQERARRDQSLDRRLAENKDIKEKLEEYRCRCDDLLMKLNIEKGKVAELETQIKMNTRTSKTIKTIETQLQEEMKCCEKRNTTNVEASDNTSPGRGGLVDPNKGRKNSRKSGTSPGFSNPNTVPDSNATATSPGLKSSNVSPRCDGSPANPLSNDVAPSPDTKEYTASPYSDDNTTSPDVKSYHKTPGSDDITLSSVFKDCTSPSVNEAYRPNPVSESAPKKNNDESPDVSSQNTKRCMFRNVSTEQADQYKQSKESGKKRTSCGSLGFDPSKSEPLLAKVKDAANTPSDVIVQPRKGKLSPENDLKSGPNNADESVNLKSAPSNADEAAHGTAPSNAVDAEVCCMSDSSSCECPSNECSKSRLSSTTLIGPPASNPPTDSENKSPQKLDDSGFTEPNKSTIEDDPGVNLNKELLSKIADLQAQLDKLKVSMYANNDPSRVRDDTGPSEENLHIDQYSDPYKKSKKRISQENPAIGVKSYDNKQTKLEESVFPATTTSESPDVKGHVTNEHDMADDVDQKQYSMTPLKSEGERYRSGPLSDVILKSQTPTVEQYITKQRRDKNEAQRRESFVENLSGQEIKSRQLLSSHLGPIKDNNENNGTFDENIKRADPTTADICSKSSPLSSPELGAKNPKYSRKNSHESEGLSNENDNYESLPATNMKFNELQSTPLQGKELAAESTLTADKYNQISPYPPLDEKKRRSNKSDKTKKHKPNTLDYSSHITPSVKRQSISKQSSPIPEQFTSSDVTLTPNQLSETPNSPSCCVKHLQPQENDPRRSLQSNKYDMSGVRPDIFPEVNKDKRAPITTDNKQYKTTQLDNTSQPSPVTDHCDQTVANSPSTEVMPLNNLQDNQNSTETDTRRKITPLKETKILPEETLDMVNAPNKHQSSSQTWPLVVPEKCMHHITHYCNCLNCICENEEMVEKEDKSPTKRQSIQEERNLTAPESRDSKKVSNGKEQPLSIMLNENEYDPLTDEKTYNNKSQYEKSVDPRSSSGGKEERKTSYNPENLIQTKSSLNVVKRQLNTPEYKEKNDPSDNENDGPTDAKSVNQNKTRPYANNEDDYKIKSSTVSDFHQPTSYQNDSELTPTTKTENCSHMCSNLRKPPKPEVAQSGYASVQTDPNLTSISSPDTSANPTMSVGTGDDAKGNNDPENQCQSTCHKEGFSCMDCPSKQQSPNKTMDSNGIKKMDRHNKYQIPGPAPTSSIPFRNNRESPRLNHQKNKHNSKRESMKSNQPRQGNFREAHTQKDSPGSPNYEQSRKGMDFPTKIYSAGSADDPIQSNTALMQSQPADTDASYGKKGPGDGTPWAPDTGGGASSNREPPTLATLAEDPSLARRARPEDYTSDLGAADAATGPRAARCAMSGKAHALDCSKCTCPDLAPNETCFCANCTKSKSRQPETSIAPITNADTDACLTQCAKSDASAPNPIDSKRDTYGSLIMALENPQGRAAQYGFKPPTFEELMMSGSRSDYDPRLDSPNKRFSSSNKDRQISFGDYPHKPYEVVPTRSSTDIFSGRGSKVVDEAVGEQLELCEATAQICKCPTVARREVAVFRSCSGTLRFRTISNTNSKFRKCSCKGLSCGAENVVVQTDDIEPEGRKTYTIEASANVEKVLRTSSPANTDQEISYMSDLPSEKTTSASPRARMKPCSPGEDRQEAREGRAAKSPGEDKTTTTSTMSSTALTSRGEMTATADTPLSEGEMPLYDAQQTYSRSRPLERQSAIPNEVRETSSAKVELALAAISEELARCRRLLLQTRSQEVTTPPAPCKLTKEASASAWDIQTGRGSNRTGPKLGPNRDGPKSGPNRDGQKTGSNRDDWLKNSNIPLRPVSGRANIGANQVPRAMFTLHVGTVVLSDEAVINYREMQLVLTWRFYDQNIAMSHMRPGRVVHFDFSTEYDLKLTDHFLNYLKTEELQINVCEVNRLDAPLAICSLPLREALLHTNRRADMSLALMAGPRIPASSKDALDTRDEVGVLDLWCMLRAEPHVLPRINDAIARASRQPMNNPINRQSTLNNVKSMSQLINSVGEYPYESSDHSDRLSDRMSDRSEYATVKGDRAGQARPARLSQQPDLGETDWRNRRDQKERSVNTKPPPPSPEYPPITRSIQTFTDEVPYEAIIDKTAAPLQGPAYPPVLDRPLPGLAKQGSVVLTINSEFSASAPSDKTEKRIPSEKQNSEIDSSRRRSSSGIIVNEVPASIKTYSQMQQALNRNYNIDANGTRRNSNKSTVTGATLNNSVDEILLNSFDRNRGRADKARNSLGTSSLGRHISENTELERKYDMMKHMLGTRKNLEAYKHVQIQKTDDGLPESLPDYFERAQGRSVDITILWLALNEECAAMTDHNVQRLYVAYNFLGRGGAELETPLSLPKPKQYQDKCVFNFKKTFQLTDADMAILGRMARCRSSSKNERAGDSVVFTIVSEPVEDPLGLNNCEDIGTAQLYFGDLVAFSAGSDTYTDVLAVRATRPADAVCGVLAVRVDGLDVVRKSMMLTSEFEAK